MNYVTISEFEDYIGSTESADLIEETGADYTRILTAFLNYAEGVVDGYAGKLYSVPIPASNLVKNWTLAIAVWEVYKRSKGNKPPEKYRMNFEDTLKQLVDMANGMIVPPPDDSGDATSPANTTGNSIDVTSDEAEMDEDSLEGF